MQPAYQHLGSFSDWVQAAKSSGTLYPVAEPGPQTQQQVREVLHATGDELPADVLVERQWEHDGVAGELISWSVGYGPRTEAWVLKPAGATQPLPGIVALHDHGGFKFYGKEKIADGPAGMLPLLVPFHATYYGERAYPNALAREGFVVLVPDTFLWGSRRFPFEAMPESIRNTAAILSRAESHETEPSDISRYNAAASLHEHVVEKYCTVLGTTLAAVVAYEDRVALNYLRSRRDVIQGRIGCIGLSGGGCRAALLGATSDQIAATVVVGMMSTYPHLLDHNVVSHTWMLFPSGWARYGDWPDLVACRAPSPLLVQYDLDDNLFTVDGMRAADVRLTQHYRSAGDPDGYTGEFYPGPHKFDLPMQASAFSWLRRRLVDDVAAETRLVS